MLLLQTDALPDGVKSNGEIDLERYRDVLLRLPCPLYGVRY